MRALLKYDLNKAKTKATDKVVPFVGADGRVYVHNQTTGVFVDAEAAGCKLTRQNSKTPAQGEALGGGIEDADTAQDEVIA